MQLETPLWKLEPHLLVPKDPPLSPSITGGDWLRCEVELGDRKFDYVCREPRSYHAAVDIMKESGVIVEESHSGVGTLRYALLSGFTKEAKNAILYTFSKSKSFARFKDGNRAVLDLISLIETYEFAQPSKD